MNIKVDFDNIVVKEDKNDFNVKVLMLKGEKGEAGATSWGAITGTLSNQTDLKNALDGKASQSDFNTVSGQVNTNTSNISTINGQITDINGELDDFEDLFYGNATVNDENTSITLENTVEAKFESFDLKGNTSQSGTPTPSNPIPVNVVSGDNEIHISKDVNIFNMQYYAEQNSAYFTYSQTNGLTMLQNDYRAIDLITAWNVQANTTYYIKCEHDIGMVFAEYNSNGGWLKNTNVNNGSSVKTSVNTAKIRLKVSDTSIAKPYNIGYLYISTSDNYQVSNYLVNLPEGMELCKIGTYQDYIYKENKKWYKYKAIDKVVLDGTQNIPLASGTPRRFNATYTALGIDNVKSGSTALETQNNYRMCDHFAYTSGVNTWGMYYLHNNWLVMLDGESVIASANDLKNWLASNPTTIYYVLAEPTTEEITDTTLISQLNAIEQATSKNGETNISQINNDLPFILDVEAFLDTYNGRYANLLNNINISIYDSLESEY